MQPSLERSGGYRVRKSGCVVRRGVETTSEFVAELAAATAVEVNAKATARAAHGAPLRVQLTAPARGWVSFKCLEAAPEPARRDGCDDDGHALGRGPGASGVSLGCAGGWRDEFSEDQILEMRRRAKEDVEGTRDPRSARPPIVPRARFAPGKEAEAAAAPPPSSSDPWEKLMPRKPGTSTVSYKFKSDAWLDGDYEVTVDDDAGTRTLSSAEWDRERGISRPPAAAAPAKPARWRDDLAPSDIAELRRKAMCEVEGLDYVPRKRRTATSPFADAASTDPAPRLPGKTREGRGAMSAFAAAATEGLEASHEPPEPEDWQASFRALREAAADGPDDALAASASKHSPSRRSPHLPHHQADVGVHGVPSRSALGEVCAKMESARMSCG